MAGEQAAERFGVDAARGLIADAARSSLRDAERLVGETFARQGETRTAKEVVQQSERELLSRLSDVDRTAISTFKREADAAESAITPKLERIVASTSGAELAGREFARKSEESLARKVATAMLRGKTAREALDAIKDSVRYTIKSSDEDYGRVTQDAVDKLKGEGFTPLEVKNSWGDATGYRGINSFWRDEATGKVIEVQFHTDSSLMAKELTHPIYDLERLPSLGDDAAGRLRELQNRVFDEVPVPSGAPSVGWPAVGPP
jgi:hypothetical protein